MFAEAIRSRQALAELHSVQEALTAVADKLGPQQVALKATVSLIQDGIKKILDGNGARSGDALGLQLASSDIASALRVVESGNRTVPSQALAVFDESERAAKLRIAEWSEIKTLRLPDLNNALKQANQRPISIE